MIFVVTVLIRIPIYFGYLNPGETMIFLFSSILPPGVSFLIAALGSAMADLVSGYTAYVAFTFVIKGLEGFIFSTLIYKMKKSYKMGYLLCTGVLVVGYFMTEVILYKEVGVALAAIIPNTVQGIFGAMVASALFPYLSKIRSNQNING